MARTIKKKKKIIQSKKPKSKLLPKKMTKKSLPISKKKPPLKKTIKKSAPKKTLRPVASPAKKLTKKAAPKKILSLKTKKAVAPKTAAPVLPTPPLTSPVKVTLKSDLSVGSKAPPFEMPATLLGNINSETLKGKIYVLYFYPKDDTSGCTAEACEFRNTLPDFAQLGVTVIGVSKDNLESHEKFSRKYSLNFPLASDQNTAVCESFGTWTSKSMYGRSYMGIERSTFLIDGEGTIRALWRKVSVPGHIEEVQQAVKNL